MLEGESIIQGVQGAGAPGGETQNGGAADAPVGDEQWAALDEVGAGDGGFDGLDGNARERAEPGRVDVEGEQGRDGRLEGVAKGLGQSAGGGSAAATGRQHETVAGQLVGIGER